MSNPTKFEQEIIVNLEELEKEHAKELAAERKKRKRKVVHMRD
jgi:hypothetical protein